MIGEEESKDDGKYSIKFLDPKKPDGQPTPV
jgi:hypothetical protein